MNRKSLQELKKLIIEDIEYQNDSIMTLEGNENLQVKEMYQNALTRKETLEDVLSYITTGSKYQFRKKVD